METAMPHSFTLPAADGSLFRSTEHLPLVVYFYPKDNTAGCTAEGLDFNRLLPEFAALGCTVAGISRDSIKSHQNFAAKHGFAFPLLSDADETVCRQFGVLKLKKLYGREYMGIERSTFILDANGGIWREWRGVKTAGHAETVLAAARELRGG